MKRYARYSSDNQRDASIEDQLRVCQALAKDRGWTVVQASLEARDAIRSLVGEVVLTPGAERGVVNATPRGDLAAILTVAEQIKTPEVNLPPES